LPGEAGWDYLDFVFLGLGWFAQTWAAKPLSRCCL
jgi:hypothetical protein